ncbi:MAG TPA: hypothetical protein VGO43_00770 [Pyrinomonadaceae bacterium]|nr:hypothetical protein [Pyrinomonadaceae bacterium]
MAVDLEPDGLAKDLAPDLVGETDRDLLLEVDLADDFLGGDFLAGEDFDAPFEPVEPLPVLDVVPDFLTADFFRAAPSPVTASAAEIVAPATAPDAAPERTSPTTSFALSYIAAIVPLDRDRFVLIAI